MEAGVSETNNALEILEAEQVADLLKIKVRALYVHVERNRIPHRRLGRRIIFSRAAIEAWLAGKDAA